VSSAPPLAGVRVLDLSRYLPGPYATLLLAELGADVVKVEPPAGDPARYLPPYEPDGTSTLHAFLGRGKRSVVLDLSDAGARAQAQGLALASDVVVETFRPGVMARLGLDPTELREQRPGLIVCSITGFGQDGPIRLRAGHDLTYLAYAGVLGMAGPVDGAPVVPPVQIADIGAGAQPAVIAILAALLERERSGEGAHLDVAMTGGAAHWIGPQLRAARLGLPAAPRGRDLLSGGLACYGCYETADGRHLAIAPLEPRFFANLLERLGRSDLQELQLDPERQGYVAAELAAAFRTRPLADWLELLEDADCCVAPVLSAAEAEAHAATAHRLAFPWPQVELAPAAALGAHTAEVLAEVQPMPRNAGSSTSEPTRSTPSRSA
jgi:crotonobetainyl-CoA:carnitine CoA-transferase CaiB-like acyl-CoA transferase